MPATSEAVDSGEGSPHGGLSGGVSEDLGRETLADVLFEPLDLSGGEVEEGAVGGLEPCNEGFGAKLLRYGPAFGDVEPETQGTGADASVSTRRVRRRLATTDLASSLVGGAGGSTAGTAKRGRGGIKGVAKEGVPQAPLQKRVEPIGVSHFCRRPQ